jgi:hypothetical protein
MWCLLSGIKAPQSGIDQTLASRVEVKKAWSFNSAPLVFFPDAMLTAVRDFTFT